MNRVLIFVLVVVLAGCGDRSFHGKDIAHLMPPLAFDLVDERGQAVDESIFAGRPVAIYFGFSHCPDICPMTLAKLAAAARALPEAQRERLQLAFVSVDPARDTPERLAEYTGAFSDRMIGLTGDQRQLTELTRRYRVTYGYEEPDAQGNYEVSHSSAIWVFGPELEARLMLFDNLAISEMAADLKRVLAESG
ncbi:MAG: SCO family protein [Wenzhouxiangellaceae bacterium]|nr:SCO family protein [Wenzhouxiangellaceae bacterium]